MYELVNICVGFALGHINFILFVHLFSTLSPNTSAVSGWIRALVLCSQYITTGILVTLVSSNLSIFMGPFFSILFRDLIDDIDVYYKMANDHELHEEVTKHWLICAEIDQGSCRMFCLGQWPRNQFSFKTKELHILNQVVLLLHWILLHWVLWHQHS